MKIAVFGGSRPRPGDAAYEQAYRLGKFLGGAGFSVLTGGYMGTMEAVSRGANESGGWVIGVTCDQIEQWRASSPNPWVQEEIRVQTLKERLHTLIDHCDAALVLPGGIGTLAEFAVMWSQLQTRAISPRPLILVGPGWQAVFEMLVTQFEDYIPRDHCQFVMFAPGEAEAFQLLLQELGNE